MDPNQIISDVSKRLGVSKNKLLEEINSYAGSFEALAKNSFGPEEQKDILVTAQNKQNPFQKAIVLHSDLADYDLKFVKKRSDDGHYSILIRQIRQKNGILRGQKEKYTKTAALLRASA